MTEFFAGAGGTSQGAAVVPGLRQVLAANHSRVAMSTHAANCRSGYACSAWRSLKSASDP
jgi:site-specific DNA-cytosine methylase